MPLFDRNLPFWLQEEITEDDIEDGFKNMFQQLAGEVGTAVSRQALGSPRQVPGVGKGWDPLPSDCREEGLPKGGLLWTRDVPGASWCHPPDK